jgi:hypothetical protein
VEGFDLFKDGSRFINSNEGYVALYKGKKITQDEYYKLCKELNVSNIKEVNLISKGEM